MDGISKRKVLEVEEMDKLVRLLAESNLWILRNDTRDILDGLRKRGFKLNLGYNDTGLLPLVWRRGGGYYLGNSHFIYVELSERAQDITMLPCLFHRCWRKSANY